MLPPTVLLMLLAEKNGELHTGAGVETVEELLKEWPVAQLLGHSKGSL